MSNIINVKPSKKGKPLGGYPWKKIIIYIILFIIIALLFTKGFTINGKHYRLTFGPHHTQSNEILMEELNNK